MSKTRTSISIDGQALERGQQRAANLGYGSFSEYVEYLINHDADKRRAHLVARHGNEVCHGNAALRLLEDLSLSAAHEVPSSRAHSAASGTLPARHLPTSTRPTVAPASTPRPPVGFLTVTETRHVMVEIETAIDALSNHLAEGWRLSKLLRRKDQGGDAVLPLGYLELSFERSQTKPAEPSSQKPEPALEKGAAK